MYEIGTKIVYGSSGVCTIKDITDGSNVGGQAGRKYYVIKPVNGECMIYAPTDSGIYMRPVLTRAEAEDLISSIKDIEPEAYYAKSVQQLGTHYEEMLKAHDCATLLELLMSINKKKQCVAEKKQKFGQLDERFLKKTKELLYTELAVALDMPVDDVEKYIMKCIQDSKK